MHLFKMFLCNKEVLKTLTILKEKYYLKSLNIQHDLNALLVHTLKGLTKEFLNARRLLDRLFDDFEKLLKL